MSMERTARTYGYDDARDPIGEHRVSNSEVQPGDDDQPHLSPVIMTPINPKRGGFRGKLPNTKLAAKARQDASLVFAQKVGRTILEMRDRGMTLRKIADRMNADGIATRTGKGKWRAVSVKRVLDRLTGSDREG